MKMISWKSAAVTAALMLLVPPGLTGAQSEPALEPGSPFPPFMFGMYGETGHYAALRDYCGEPRNVKPRAPRKIVVLSFFTRTCVNCKAEIRHLNRLAPQWGDEVAVFLVSVGDKPDEIRQWLEENPTDLTILMDIYKTSIERYDVKSTPRTFVVDREGILRYSKRGYSEGDEKAIDNAVRELLVKQKAEKEKAVPENG